MMKVKLKKCAMMLLMASVTAGSSVGTPITALADNGSGYVVGDVNGDKVVDVKDVALIKRKLAGWDVNFVSDGDDGNLPSDGTDTELKVKDVVGTQYENAKVILENQGFNVVIKEEYSDEVEVGYVISQSPSAENDLTLSKGDTVTLAVSKGKEPVNAKYLDTIVYSSFSAECKETKMSAYTGKDLWGNDCERAVEFICDGRRSLYDNPNDTHYVRVKYAVNDINNFSAILTPLSFGAYSSGYIHVSLYKDEERLFSMDISDNSKPLELEYDLSGAEVFTIELSYESVSELSYDNNMSVILSNAKFDEEIIESNEKDSVKYLDTMVYSSFSVECKETKMSAYTGEDWWGNDCERAVKFKCDGRRSHYDNPNDTHYVRVKYAVNDINNFSAILTPLLFGAYSSGYIHVSLYKDEERLFSMDISDNSKPLELEYDLSDAEVFTIELSYESVSELSYYNNMSVILSNAKFE